MFVQLFQIILNKKVKGAIIPYNSLVVSSKCVGALSFVI